MLCLNHPGVTRIIHSVSSCPTKTLLQPDWCPNHLKAYLACASQPSFAPIDTHTHSSHVLTHSQLMHTHTSAYSQNQPNHTIPSQCLCLVPSLRPPQPLCSPFTHSLSTTFWLCILVVSHRLPCTMNYLAGARFFSPNVLHVPGRKLYVSSAHSTELDASENIY